MKGIVELYVRKPNLLISEAMILSFSKENLPKYLKKVGKIHIFLGVFIAVMGQIEYRYNPELWTFILVYVVIGLACIARIIYLNKEYSGDYLLRI
ncbi:hypothetical protein GWK91_09535 [Virgibacillus sp. MSP4-1]|uniref:hypothetical protein n=1 Tax=Virgibacillus sp. MSP4-1 TaxID=2700081 RepID=UPI00137B987C|nr:hypothetical protein [Virgibacillus sp. MSP4-1]QHS23174.1 hypothetical protein GWK91_09535 [Virgibacillus sp. MSP4-1]